MITMKTLELKIMDIITYNEDTKQVEDRGYNDVDKRKWESKCHYLSENEQKNCYIYKVRSIEDFAKSNILDFSNFAKKIICILFHFQCDTHKSMFYLMVAFCLVLKNATMRSNQSK